MHKCNTPNCTANDFSSSGCGVSTSMGWEPRYDGQGRPLNADPNTSSWDYRCNDCGTSYFRVNKGWITEYWRGKSREPGQEPFLIFDSTPDYLKESK